MDKIESILLEIPIPNMKVPINDTVKRVEEEGIGARNLLNWISDGLLEVPKASRRPPSSPRLQSTSPNPLERGNDSKFQFKTNKRRSSISRPKNRLRSASAGRNPEKDLRARYWTFLFENLHRAVDEIYQTCEMDESIVESKEAIMMLENYSKDFHALIQWLNISKSYEKTAPIDRPTSLAWEVRKSSPGKSLLKNVFIEKLTAGNSQAKRVLCFDSSCEQTLLQTAVENMFSDSSEVSNNKILCIPNQSSSQETLDEKSEMEKENIRNVLSLENASDLKISVHHKSADELFPCNKDLVIQEIEVVNGVSSMETEMDESSDLIEASKGSIEDLSEEECGDDPPVVSKEIKQALDHDNIKISVENDGAEMQEENAKSESTVEVDAEKSTEVKTVKNVETVTLKEEGKQGNVPSIQNPSLVVVPKKDSFGKKSAIKKSQPTVAKKVAAEETPKSSEPTALKSEAGIKKEQVTKNEKKSVCTVFNNDVSSFPKIKDTIRVKSVPKKTLISTVKPIIKKASSAELLSTSSKTNPSPLEPAPKISEGKKEEPSNKTIAGKTEKSPPTRSTTSTNVEPSKLSKPNLGNKSSVSTLTRSKTCVINSVSTSSKQNPSSENPITPPSWVSFTKPISTAAKKVVARTPSAPSEKKTLRSGTAGEQAAKKVTPVTPISQEKRIAAKPAAVSNVVVRKVVPARTVSYAVKLPQKSGSLSSLHVPSRKSWAEKTSSAEQISNIERAKEDCDGWETVRGRTRSRNSPAKKLPQSNATNSNQVAQIAKLNQSRIGGFPYTTKASSSTNVSKSSIQNKKDSSNLKSEDKNQSKSADQLKTIASSESLKKKSTPSSTATNRTLLNSKKTSTTLNSNSKLTASTNKPSKKTNDEKENKSCDKAVLANNVSKDPTITNKSDELLNLHENSENLEETKQQKKESMTLPLKALYSAMNTECSYYLSSRDLIKSSSAPSLCNIYEEIDFSSKKALSDNEQAFEQSIKRSIKVYKKRNSDKGAYSSNRDASMDESIIRTSLDENEAEMTPEDQDDMLCHDEAYDVQTRELYDTARKYKILEEQVHKLELSWGEQMDKLDMELRTPGRALEMHEKLSSPFRKRSILESIRLCNEKQVKAQEQRERFLEEKAQKFKDIQKKRQEMRTLVEKRQEQQRIIMEQKLERAEKQRKKQLEIIVKKAHDEEEKVNEIAFINTLEAQNKRHDLISKEKDHEARLQDIQDERQRRQEEKAAKEAAAEERRKVLEADRQARLIEMQEKRKLKDLKIEQQFLEKEKERQELANQKARDRELRLSALNAAQQTTIEELQKKIQLKQEESARRHEENIEQIRLKAFELSVRRCSSNNDDAPQPVPYETKKICTICNVLIGSEVYLLSHLRGKKHMEAVKDQHQGQDPSTEELELYNLKHIVDASTDQLDPNIAMDKERQKALKKRCKKLRQRMSNRGLEYESQLQEMVKQPTSNTKNKMQKIINDIKKLLSNHDNGMNDNSFLNSLDRLLNDLEQIHNKDKVAFCRFGGIGVLVDIFSKVSNLLNESNAFILKKIIAHASKTAEHFLENCYENCHYALFSNKIGSLLDLLIQRLNTLIPDNFNKVVANSCKPSGITLQVDLVSGKLMHFLNIILITLSEPEETDPAATDIHILQSKDKEKLKDDFQQRVQDSISYIVSIGIVDKLALFCNSIQGPIANEAEVAPFLLDSIAFLTSLIKLFSKSSNSSAEQKKTEDTTQLIATFKLTNMVGSVSLLYGLLLHSGASSRGDIQPQPIPQHTVQVALSTLSMLNHVAVMNLSAFQSILGSEGLSLQFRHITSHLLWYCSHCTSEALLHEVILLIGYFTVLNPENQLIIQAGQRPTVLQQLCSLPFLYFSDLDLIDILFPTLISCCFNNDSNKTILEQEMSSELLSNYIEGQSLNIHQTSQLMNKNKNSVKRRWLCSARFPKDRWSSARQYFTVDN